MERAFQKFCEQIDFKINDYLIDSKINNVVINNDAKNSVTFFDVSFFSIPTYEELVSFYDKSKLFFTPTNLKIKISFINKNYSDKRIYDLLNFGAKLLFNKNLDEFLNANNITFDISKNKTILEFNTLIDQMNFEKYINISNFKSFFDINDLNFEFKTKMTFNFNEDTSNNDEFKNFIKKQQENKVQVVSTKNFPNKSTRKIFQMNMENFYTTPEKFIKVEGKIFNIEKLTTKTNLTIISVFIFDATEAITAKYFVREGEKDKYEWLKIGTNISVTGEKKQEYNSSNYFLQIISIDEIKEEKNSIKKEENLERIELSVRSSLSAMDGFISATDLMKHAKKIGSKSIAFVDYQNIQAFPEIFNNAKKIGIKPIYGCTFSIISKKHNLIKNNNSSELLKKGNYVIFDLETTSLNPRNGEIIEFGAIIVENFKVKDNLQFFIKPSQQISKFTTELTGITQDMLDKQAKFDNQKDAILEIKKIFKNYALVAHNAQFDIGYINQKLFESALNEIENPIIDTLAVAKYLFPISISYRLEVVCKKMNIIYDASIAHRADYDANVLEQVWLNMIELLERKNINTFDDLAKINDSSLNNKKISYDIAIYAKNQQGVKELFKLVSHSLTNNYHEGPRLFEEDLKDHKNIIVGPASINTRLMDLAFTGTTKDLEQEIDKWDFIGIPSPHLFSHLISRQNIKEEEIKSILKEIVLIAKKKNKLVIAIGDVRYIDEEDIVAHHIYINTKGLEGRRHPLYKYNEQNPQYPIQKYLSTNEMLKQFEFLNSEKLIKEIVIDNTITFDSLIEDNIEIIKSKLYPPEFDNSQEKLQNLVFQNAHKIYGKKLPDVIEKRIYKELEPINKYGFSVIYWISHKLVQKSLNDGYLVGSRGSVGSSIVATLSKITEVNPLSPHYICYQCNYNEFVENPITTSGFDLDDKLCPNCSTNLHKDGQTIPFETFLGFDGDKVPDIDLNFSGEYQPIIHEEVRNIFGKSKTFRAGTISTVASKTAFGFVKKYFEDNKIEKSNIYINFLAQKIEGSKRTTGQHPGGIIIIPQEFDVEDFTPVNYPANDIESAWKTTHFDFHAIHDNILKLDLLGHDDPTVIKLLQEWTKVKIEEISFSDKNVLELFSSTKPLGIESKDINNEQTGVLGIPEFGTKFVRKMLKVAKPASFNDLINISGLSHGTNVWNGNAEDLIKQGKKLNEVISCRDDIMVYLMKKGVSPSSSFQIMEKVRKGKGLTSEDEKLLRENGIENWYINSLNKIKYMFPKAHATAYVMMAWRIAWFKIYYPLEYYAAFYTVRPDVFDLESAISSKEKIEKKIKELESKQYSNSKEKITQKEESLIPIFEIINEMLARGFKILNIDLNLSEATSWKIDYQNKALIPPFIVVDGLGITAANSIVEARNKKSFTSKDDLMKRTLINKTTLDKFENLGIIEHLNPTDQIKLF